MASCVLAVNRGLARLGATRRGIEFHVWQAWNGLERIGSGCMVRLAMQVRRCVDETVTGGRNETDSLLEQRVR